MLLVHGGEGAVVDVVKQQEIVVCNVNNQQFFLTEEPFLLILVHCARKYRGRRGSNPGWPGRASGSLH
jgi:hypothetical protein